MCSGTSSGRLSQIFHFGPLIAIFLISFITSLGFICLVQWWPADMNNDPLSVLHMSLYLTWPIIIFYNYFNAVFLGPGFVPYQWKPVSFRKLFISDSHRGRLFVTIQFVFVLFMFYKKGE